MHIRRRGKNQQLQQLPAFFFALHTYSFLPLYERTTYEKTLSNQIKFSPLAINQNEYFKKLMRSLLITFKIKKN